MHSRYYDERTADDDRLSPAMRAQLERYERAYGSDRGGKKLKARQRRGREDWIAIH